jgi:beta-phosphoglucomutase-like phosphatase (HAD superfamily)
MSPIQEAQRAIILDCDGVLADTERHAHLPAFNMMFDEFGLPVRWSEGEYDQLLQIGGGKERLQTLLTPEFVARAGLPVVEADQLALVKRWHERKTEIYSRLVRSGAVPGRAGIVRLVDLALAAGWQVAVASTSAEDSVRAVLESVVGASRASRFQVFAGDAVARKKPAPDIYLAAIEHLGLPVGSMIAIEDTRNGLLAATAAGLACIVTVNQQSRSDDFSEAILVVDSLGDPDGERTTVLANRGRAQPTDFITLTDLIDSMPIGVTAL